MPPVVVWPGFLQVCLQQCSAGRSSKSRNLILSEPARDAVPEVHVRRLVAPFVATTVPAWHASGWLIMCKLPHASTAERVPLPPTIVTRPTSYTPAAVELEGAGCLGDYTVSGSIRPCEGHAHLHPRQLARHPWVGRLDGVDRGRRVGGS